MHTWTLIAVLLFSSLAWSQVQLRYEGYVEDGGSPVNATSQAFTVRIRKPGCATPAPGLADYSTATVDIVNGEFNLTPTYNENEFAAAMDPLTDWGGGGTCVPGSARELQIVWAGETFNVALQDAPRALVSKVAQSAQNLGARNQDQFLKIDSFPAQTPLNNAQVNTLLGLVNGTATTYLKPTDTPAGDLAGTYASPVVDGIQNVPVLVTPPTLNQVLKYNGAAWAPANESMPADASYTSKGAVQFLTDQATSGIQVAAGIASLPNLIAAGGPVGNTSTIPVITYDNKGRLTTVSTVTVNDNTKLPLIGGTMTGALDMGNQNITNVNSVSATSLGARSLRIFDADNSNYLDLQSPSVLTSNYALTWPGDDGAPGQVLTTDGSGNLSWVLPAAGAAAAGASGQIQYNNAGGFAATSNLTWDFTNSRLGIRTATPLIPLDVRNGNFKTTTAAPSFIGQFGSIDVAPLAIRFGFRGNATAANRYGAIEVDDEGTKRPLVLQPNSTGFVGIGTTDALPPTSTLDVFGAMTLRGVASPGTAPSSQGRIYFDSTANKFKVSENGSAFIDLVGAGGDLSQAGIFSSQNSNTRIGFNAGSNFIITNLENSVFGAGAGQFLSATASRNTLMGAFSGNSLTSGNENVLIGRSAGEALTIQSNNIFIGTNSGRSVNGAGAFGNVILGSHDGSIISNQTNHVLISDGSGNERLLINNNSFAKFSGPVKFGTSSDPCNASLSGALRNPSGAIIEICNGSAWVAFGGGAWSFVSPSPSTRATPSYNFVGAIASGLYMDSASSDLGLTTSGVERLRVKSSNGHVAIMGSTGPTDPQYPLHVNPGVVGSSSQVAQFEGSIKARLNQNNFTNFEPSLIIENADGNGSSAAAAEFVSWNAGVPIPVGKIISGKAGAGGYLKFQTRNPSTLTYQDSLLMVDNKLSVGTNFPLAKLHLRDPSSSPQEILIQNIVSGFSAGEGLAVGVDSTGGGRINSRTPASTLRLGTNNVDSLFINQNFVGVGVVPSVDFEVMGETILLSELGNSRMNLEDAKIELSTSGSTVPIELLTFDTDSDILARTTGSGSDISINTTGANSKVVIDGAAGSLIRKARIQPQVYTPPNFNGGVTSIDPLNGEEYIRVAQQSGTNIISTIVGCAEGDYAEGQKITIVVGAWAAGTLSFVDSLSSLDPGLNTLLLDGN